MTLDAIFDAPPLVQAVIGLLVGVITGFLAFNPVRIQ